MKAGEPSTTATWVSFLRGLATLEEGAVVEDGVALALVPRAYAALLRAAEQGPRSRRLVRGAAHVLTGGHRWDLAVRTRAIDDGLRTATLGGARQVVIVGAGLDGRAWRLGALSESTVFEVDAPSMQAYKQRKVARLVATAREVRFLPLDLEAQALGPALERAGFDRARQAVFVCEGVIAYLSRPAINAALSAIAGLAAVGSTLIATYLEPRGSSRGMRAFSRLARAAGEPHRTWLWPFEARAMLERHGFAVMRDESHAELAARLLPMDTPPGALVAGHVLTAVRG